MINPAKTLETKGVVKSVETYTSMIVYKIETKHGIFDYTVFNFNADTLNEGTALNVAIGYSITLDGYMIKYVDHETMRAA